MFRGLWVPAVVDEVTARLQWSFNSFSRDAEGVRRVLRFYAKSRGTRIATLANEARHVLFLVARCHSEEENWAFPMQFFSSHGSREGSLERELMLPPFVAYDFESDLEVSSEMPGILRAEKISFLEKRWGLPKFFATEAPKLMRWLEAPRTMLLHDLLGAPPKLSVRFVRHVTLAEPLRSLLEAQVPEVPGLLEFPQCWRVVGGEQSGGLLVRSGPNLDTAELPERLQFGALVAGLETRGARMHYRKLSGGGPQEGWITRYVQQSGKLLVVRES